jgi:hypothetical protein
MPGVGQDAGRSHNREAAAPHIGVDLERQLEDHCLGEVQHDAAAGDPHLHPVRREPARAWCYWCGSRCEPAPAGVQRECNPRRDHLGGLAVGLLPEQLRGRAT